MKLSAILAPLVAAKADHETIMAVVLAYEAENADKLEKRRGADRERQAKRRGLSRESRDPSVTSRDRLLAGDHVTRVEDNNPSQKIITSKKTNTREADLDGFKAEFPDLDAERVDNLVKHRRRKNGALTAHAARLFRKDAAACSLSLPDAVDACISRNWITVKPEYFRARAQAPPPESRTAFTDHLRSKRAEHESRTFDADPGSPVLNFPALVASRQL